MKRVLLATVAVVLLAGPAMSQAVVIAPEQRKVIKEYVVKEKRAAVPPPAGFNVSVGAPLPPTVELYSFPTSAPYAKYRYSVVGNETVVVDPTDRRVVEVIR